MADKLMYIPNNDIQSDPLSKVETLKYSTLESTNQNLLQVANIVRLTNKVHYFKT